MELILDSLEGSEDTKRFLNKSLIAEKPKLYLLEDFGNSGPVSPDEYADDDRTNDTSQGDDQVLVRDGGECWLGLSPCSPDGS